MHTKDKLFNSLFFSTSSLLTTPNCNLSFPIIELIFSVQRYRIAGLSQWKDRKREKKNGSLYTTSYVSRSSVMPLQNGALTSCFWRTMIHRSHAICLNAGSFPDISRDANSNCEMHRELLRSTHAFSFFTFLFYRLLSLSLSLSLSFSFSLSFSLVMAANFFFYTLNFDFSGIINDVYGVKTYNII